MKLVIEGRTGSGKSTAIRRLFKYIQRPVWGLWTEKLPAAVEDTAPVYIHSYREGLAYSEEQLVGLCQYHHAIAYPERFEAFGVPILREIPLGSLVVLDEIGVMESKAPGFQAELFRLLEGDFDLVIAVRDKKTPLLDAIRQHPQVQCVSAQQANEEAFCRTVGEALNRGNREQL